MSSPFAHAPPPAHSPTSSSPLLPILNSLLDPLPTPPRLVDLADRLLAARVKKVVKAEMYELSGALRDEWKARVGAVKADWMARIIPDNTKDEDEDGDDPSEASLDRTSTTAAVSSALEHTEVIADPTAMVVPTIISDADSQEAMSSRVDAAVEVEFNERIEEAEGRITLAAERKELMEMELFLGEVSLDSHSAGFPPDHLPHALHQAVEDALADLGVDVSVPVGAGQEIEGELKNLSHGVEGIELQGQ